ncbi:hypothetical protein [Wolbachia endosymbiont of Pentidionis agamae]|uniref:hypothetical protein n=1 Tax=Wolbachia endosymbiont of Pentidionis agamae TaxID=3110435 RepID=UPI002FD6989A
MKSIKLLKRKFGLTFLKHLGIQPDKINCELSKLYLPKYLLAEEQKIFPRISRKSGEEKDGYLTFRIVGIATKEGTL